MIHHPDNSKIYDMMIKKTRRYLVIIPWLCVLVLVYLIYTSSLPQSSAAIKIDGPSLSANTDQIKPSTTTCIESQQESIAQFHQILIKNSQLDYDETLYGIHLGLIRHKPLNFIELGFGCTTIPSHSINIWRQFLTNAHTNISLVEFDARCAAETEQLVVGGGDQHGDHMFVGDQGDVDMFLKRVGVEGGPFDVIVDNGGQKRANYQVLIYIYSLVVIKTEKW